MNSLTTNEREIVKGLPSLDAKSEDTAPTTSDFKKRKRAKEEKKLEHKEPELSQQQREARLRKEAQNLVDLRIMEATTRGLKALPTRYSTTEEERKEITDAVWIWRRNWLLWKRSLRRSWGLAKCSKRGLSARAIIGLN